MANSTTNLDLISSSQAQKEVTANQLFDAVSMSAVGGRRGSTTTGLTWGYYGGNVIDNTSAVVSISNGTLTLNASTTNYIQLNETTSAITVNTSGFTGAGFKKLYLVVTGTSTVTSYTDYRTTMSSLPTASNTVAGVVKVDNITTKMTAGVISAAVGLDNFDEYLYDTSPNVTVNVCQLTPDTSTTNADIAYTPKGNGAVLSHIPDNSTTGGNRRGIYSFDFQRSRTNANQVASGDYSVIVGGKNNLSSGTYSSVLAGTNNSVSDTNSSIVSGLNNIITGSSSASMIGSGDTNLISGSSYSFIGGGNTNSCSADYSCILGGFKNTANSQYSIASGRFSHTHGIKGIKVWSSSNFTSLSDGKAQKEEYHIVGETSSSSSVVLTTDKASLSTNNQVVFATKDIKSIKGEIIIVDKTTNATCAIYTVNVIARNVSGTVSILLNTVTTDYIDAAATTAGFSLVASVDSTNKAISFTASKTSGNDIAAQGVLYCSLINF